MTTKEHNLMLSLAKTVFRNKDGLQEITIMKDGEIITIPAYIKWSHVDGNQVLGEATSYGDSAAGEDPWPYAALGTAAQVAVAVREDGTGIEAGRAPIKLMGDVSGGASISQGVLLLPAHLDSE